MNGDRKLDLGGLCLHFLDGGTLGFDVEVGGRDMVLDLGSWPVLVALPDGRTCLVDASFGPADPHRLKKFHCQPGPTLEAQCADLGFAQGPDLILLTHLHFDHACGVLTKGEGASEELRFPKARLLVERSEWEAALADDRGGGLAKRILRACEGRDPEFVKDGDEPFPGLRLSLVPGHTEGLFVCWVRGTDKTALLPSDLIPSRRFLVPREDPFVDQDPPLALENRKQLLEEAFEASAVVCFYHDPKRLFGTLSRRQLGGYALS